jgi:hypothetical protein
MITEEVICKLSQSDVSNTNTESNWITFLWEGFKYKLDFFL